MEGFDIITAMLVLTFLLHPECPGQLAGETDSGAVTPLIDIHHLYTGPGVPVPGPATGIQIPDDPDYSEIHIELKR